MTTTVRIRASSLSDFMDCSRRAAANVFRTEIAAAGYALRQMEGNIAAAVGTATHAGATWELGEKARTGELGNQTEAEHRALEALKSERNLGVTFDSTTPDATTAEKQVLRQLTAYRTHVSPRIIPRAVERRLEGNAMEGVILTGQSDVAEQVEGGVGIRDIKTGVRQKYHGAQLGGYSLLGRAHGEDVKRMEVDFIQRVRLSHPQPLPERIVYDVGTVERLTWAVLKRVKADYDAFSANGDLETFLPNPSSVLCSPKYCPLWGTKGCTHHASKTAARVED